MRYVILIAAALALSGCAGFAKLETAYTYATTATVPAEVVRPIANTFDILKGTAVNFAKYCVANKFAPAGCDVATRRKIVTAIRVGTNARVQMRSSLAMGQPVLSTVYNLLVGAVTDLQATPVSTFTGGAP
jgi:hypothetical protein